MMAVWHAGMQCFVVSRSYDRQAHRGRLMMENGNCCDMSGCIKVFETIDANCQLIETFAGSQRDTIYVHRSGQWHSIGPDGFAWPPFDPAFTFGELAELLKPRPR
jgi:hypothetical protein